MRMDRVCLSQEREAAKGDLQKICFFPFSKERVSSQWLWDGPVHLWQYPMTPDMTQTPEIKILTQY